MPDYDAGFKIVARAAGPRLGQLAGLDCQEWEPLGGELQTTERLADRVFRACQHGETFIVYVEAYTRWTDSAPWSVLSKSCLLAERERLPVQPLVFESLRLNGDEPAPTWGSPVNADAGQPLRLGFAVELGSFGLDPADPSPVQIEVRSEPTWLLRAGASPRPFNLDALFLWTLLVGLLGQTADGPDGGPEVGDVCRMLGEDFEAADPWLLTVKGGIEIPAAGGGRS